MRQFPWSAKDDFNGTSWNACSFHENNIDHTFIPLNASSKQNHKYIKMVKDNISPKSPNISESIKKENIGEIKNILLFTYIGIIIFILVLFLTYNF